MTDWDEAIREALDNLVPGDTPRARDGYYLNVLSGCRVSCACEECMPIGMDEGEL